MVWRSVPLFALAAVAIGTLAAAPSAEAILIDFESIPGAGGGSTLPVDGQSISDQFSAPENGGVTFSLEGRDDPPVLAEVGNPATAFGPGDSPADLTRHGSFFLTDDGLLSGLEVVPLIVSYTVPSMAVSGDFLDIDFDEAVLIEARGAADVVLDTVLICNRPTSSTCSDLGTQAGATPGDFPTGDRATTPWSIVRPQADILSLRIVGERNVSGYFGLAFDNFDSGVSMPEPGTALLLGAALLPLAAARRRRARDRARGAVFDGARAIT